MTIPGVPAIRRLDWDSAHFGFPVFEVTAADIDEAVLLTALQECASRDASLVYWFARTEQTVSPGLLRRYRGTLVDRKRTYSMPLSAASYRSMPPGWVLAKRDRGPADHSLRGLARSAGWYSRFRVDQRMPSRIFPTLYDHWIEASCRHELADAVLEVRSGSDSLDGMVTLQVKGETGAIGLIAVSESARGRGLAGALLASAHQEMCIRGAQVSHVVTQAVNHAACKLYEAANYSLLSETAVYHFWLRKEK